MMRQLVLWIGLALVAACGDEEPRSATEGRKPARPNPPPKQNDTGAPERVTYEQIFITFRGAIKLAGPHDKRATNNRTRAEAEKLAKSLYERVKAGIDFELLKQEYTDDRADGKIQTNVTAVNDGLPYRPHMREVPRENMFRAFADAVFSLKVGEIAFVEWHERHCADGWHIVRRVR